MSVKIIVDSTADLLPQIKAQVLVVPLTVRFGDAEYIDGVTITHQEFYEKLTRSDVLPTTSQATPAAFAAMFEEVTKTGDSAVVLTLSSGFSGTYQSACIAAEDFPNVFVVDSGTATIGTGILTQRALALAETGMDAGAIARQLEGEKEDVTIVAMVDTLEYLKKGGRVSAAVAFAGGLLNIKPIIGVEKGQINMLGKARGAKQGNTLLLQQVAKAGGMDLDRPVLFGYTGTSAQQLEKFMEDSDLRYRYTCIGSVIGTHAGPDAVAMAFFKK